MAKDLCETVINNYVHTVKIIVNDTIIDNSQLQWRESEIGGLELTLDEIATQIDEHGVIYVWVEGGLEGRIYQFGNYSDCKWHEHGKTKGYA